MMIDLLQAWPLFFLGLLAGFVDSIAGGGGLISLPALASWVGPGTQAIASNKIAAGCGALMALWVYHKKGHFEFQKSLIFASTTALGSLGGSLVSPLLPARSFQYALMVTCPVILWIVWNKDLWVKNGFNNERIESSQTPSAQQSNTLQQESSSVWKVALAGFLCGSYDGAWGPGAGTLMLLSLVFFARMPLFSALATSKLANSCSALFSLTSYQVQGLVHWGPGSLVALGVVLGAFIGAHLASRSAARIVRPVLAVVACLLILKIYME